MGLTCVVGLELARLADLPPNVLVESKRVAETLAELHAKQKEDSESSKIAVRRKALLRVILFLSMDFSWIYGRWYLCTLTLNLALVASNPTHASPGPFCTPRSRAPRLYSSFPKWYCQGLFECSLKSSTTLGLLLTRLATHQPRTPIPLLSLFNVTLKWSVSAVSKHLRLIFQPCFMHALFVIRRVCIKHIDTHVMYVWSAIGDNVHENTACKNV